MSDVQEHTRRRWKKWFWWVGVPLFILFVIHRSLAAPQIRLAQPQAEHQAVVYDEAFLVSFDQLMHQRSVMDAFKITPHVDGQLSWDDRRTLRFKPDQPLDIDDEYHIQIKKTAKSLWFKPMEFEGSVNYRVTGPPFVRFFDPQDQATLAEKGSITVMFDQPMEFEGLKASDLIQTEPSLEGAIQTVGKSAFQFTPNNLEPKKQYQIRIPAGIPAQSGGKTEEEITWTLRTPLAQVVHVSPSPYQTVELDQAIELRFDQAVDLGQIQPGLNAQLFPSNDVDAAENPQNDGFFNTEVRYGQDENGETDETHLIFTPTFPYLPGVDYRFVLKNNDALQLENDFELYFKTQAETEEAPLTEPTPQGWENEKQSFSTEESMVLSLASEMTEEAKLKTCHISTTDYLSQSLSTLDCSEIPETLDTPFKTVELEPKELGIYLVDLNTENQTLKTAVWRENVHLFLKKLEVGWMVWAVDLKSGEPVSNLNLFFWGGDGRLLAQGLTDSEGYFELKDDGVDVFWVEGKNEVYWGLGARSNPPEGARGNLNAAEWQLEQTEYRPGQTVKVHGFIKGGSALPAQLILKRGSQIVNTKMLNDVLDGGFSAQIPLAHQEGEGAYYLQLQQSGMDLVEPLKFFVNEEKGHVELRWQKAPTRLLKLNDDSFELAASYPNGLPAAGVEGQYYLRDDKGVELFRGELLFDPQGNVNLAINPDLDLEVGAYQWEVIALQNRQVVGWKTHSFSLTSAPWTLDLKVDHHLIKNTEKLGGAFTLKNHLGAPLRNVKTRIRLESSEKILIEKSIESEGLETPFSLDLGSGLGAGRYFLKAEAEDSEGRTVNQTETLVIYNQNEAALKDFEILTDHAKFLPGEPVNLAINLPGVSTQAPEKVLLTAEKQGVVLASKTLELKKEWTFFDFPTTSKMSSGVDFRVIRASETESNEASVFVGVGPQDEAKLDMELDPPQPKPGEEMTVRFALKEGDKGEQGTLMVNVLEKEGQGDSLYFESNLKTNESGQAEITFKLPQDNQDVVIEAMGYTLSAWTKAREVISMQDALLLRPVLPNALHPGDQTQLGTRVKNMTPDALEVVLEIEVNDAVASNPLQTLKLNPGEERRVDFEVRVDPRATTDALNIKFLSNRDAVSVKLPLKQKKVWVDVAKIGTISNVWSNVFPLPTGQRAEAGELSVYLGKSPLTLIYSAFKQLQTEKDQTAFGVAVEILAQLTLKESATDMNFLQKEVDQLTKQVNDWGGVSFWQHSSNALPMTLLTGLALAKANESDLVVDTTTLNQLLTYLLENFEDETLAPAQKGMILWILAEHGQYDTEATLEAYKKLEKEDVAARAFLLLTFDHLLKAGQNGVSPFMDDLKQELNQLTRQAPNGRFFEEESRADRLLTTAQVFYALARLDSANPLLLELMDYMSHQAMLSEPHQAYEKLWLILALSAWEVDSGNLEQDAYARVRLNGHSLNQPEAVEGWPHDLFKLIAGGDLFRTEGQNDVLIQTSGPQELYADASLLSYVSVEELQALESGVIVDRHLYQKEDEKQIPVDHLEQGEIYVSHLRLIVPQDLYGVEVFDPGLAGGWLTPISTLFPFEGVELEGGGLRYFASVLPAGVYELKAEFRALLPGNYAQTPAEITTLLAPGFYARTAGGRLSVE